MSVTGSPCQVRGNIWEALLGILLVATVTDDAFRGLEAVEFVFQSGLSLELRDPKIPRTQVHDGKPVEFLVLRHGDEEVALA